MRSAVVVGAGVGGLATAGALARAGWQVTLLERADRLRGGGAAQLIWPNGVAALGALGLGRGLDAIAFPMSAGGIRRPDGRWLVEAGSAAAVGDPVVVHADDLHDTLMAGLTDAVDIRTGIDVTTVRTGDRATVGTARHTFEADLLVAADGGHSLIRQRLAPEARLVSGGYTTWRAVIPWFRAPKLPDSAPQAGELLGAGLRFMYATLGDRGSAGGSTRGGIYWSATARGAARPEVAATQLDLLRRWFASWQAPVADLLSATEADDLVQRPGEELNPLPRRFDVPVGTGGFVLLGDAAHLATPNLTQGACLAFEDAATLGALVRDAAPGPRLVGALVAYTQARRARVARVARSSRQVGRVMQAQGRLAVQARDAALSTISSRLLDRAATAPLNWQPPQ